jgi:LmbE family N-acetylglucosaminyl deacetylase
MTTPPPIPALFIAAHPDDHTLAMGVTIAEHCALGRDVHALILTDGTTSGVLGWLNGSGVSSYWGVAHNPAAEGYEPLTPEQFGTSRIAESDDALRQMALGYPGSLTIHHAGLMSDSLTADSVKDAITAVADQIAAPGTGVNLKGHTYVVDDHPDHIATGNAIKSLAAGSSRYASPRYYILSQYWADSRLSQVSTHWDTPTDAAIALHARNAGRCHQCWAPTAGRFAVGYHSTLTMFTNLAATADQKCLMHL